MTFTFDFDNWVWANQRRSIRNTAKTGIWYKLLSTLIQPVLDHRAAKVKYIYDQIDLINCPDEKLHLWGRRMKENQGANETFDDYRWRLFAKWVRKEGIALAKKLLIISKMSGIEVVDMLWEKTYPYTYNVGDPIGTVVSSRDYALNAYRIYMVENGQADWSAIALELEKIEKGGQIIELWIETPGGSISSIPIGSSEASPQKQYEKY